MASQLQYGLPLDDGMARCDSNASEPWKREVDAAIRAVALNNDFFTVDEVVAELERNKFHFTTHNKAAMGPRMIEVADNLKYMEVTKMFRRSNRPEAHGNPLKVWKSRIYPEAK